MTVAIARAAVVPVAAEPSTRAEQVTQMILGERAAVTGRRGDWLRLQLAPDGYAGWAHGGYLREMHPADADAWTRRAVLWSEGAVVRAGDALVRAPLRARLAPAEPGVELPDGRRGAVVAGRVVPAAEGRSEAARESPERWASRTFAGAPYLWGGLTPWGVDCSGLVQTTFAARGVALPRDASRQVAAGIEVAPGGIRPGDLLFFTDAPGASAITHVAFAGAGETLVHSTIACGGVVVESWASGSRAAALRERLAAARRIV